MLNTQTTPNTSLDHTTSANDKAYGNIARFINEKPTKQSIMKSWFQWWDERRQHVFNVFRMQLHIPTTNTSKCLHASWENTEISKLSLIDAIYDDVTDCEPPMPFVFS